MIDTIDYGKMMCRAMRGLMVELLNDIAKNGLPGDHHFFITFNTTHEKVIIPSSLRARFPLEMTIVIQHEYSDFIVTKDGFSITLSFNGVPEILVIPFDAITSLVDPTVKFSLNFDPETKNLFEDETYESPMMDTDDVPDKEETRGQAEVVSLDSFRKS